MDQLVIADAGWPMGVFSNNLNLIGVQSPTTSRWLRVWCSSWRWSWTCWSTAGGVNSFLPHHLCHSPKAGIQDSIPYYYSDNLIEKFNNSLSNTYNQLIINAFPCKREWHNFYWNSFFELIAALAHQSCHTRESGYPELFSDMMIQINSLFILAHTSIIFGGWWKFLQMILTCGNHQIDRKCRILKILRQT